MKAARATIELLALASIYFACGGVALALSADAAGSGTFVVAMAAFALIATGVLVVWIVRQLRHPHVLPDDTRLRTAWVTLNSVAGAFPAGLAIYVATLPASSTWVLAAMTVLLGGVYLLAAALAARLERQSGGRVLRANGRFFLAR